MKVEILAPLKFRQLWVLSKWGDCHEAVHLMRECPYPVPNHEFYRIVK